MELFYYKNGNSYLITKQQLEELNGYTQISERQYENYKKQQEKEHTKKSSNHIKRARINELKNLLRTSDYKVIKYVEGLLLQEEYDSIKEQRQKWRDEINSLEKDLEDE